MIELEDIWRTYQLGRSELHALAGIDEIIEEGDHVAIMGPSGSGKSTLLNIIGCLDRPTRGTYRLAGQEVGSMREDQLARVRRETIGYVFQSFHLVERLDAQGNVELPLVFAGVAPRERRQRALDALEIVGLGDRAGHRPSELSGGERQRVAIARATIQRPRVLLADEPTGNLDSTSGEAVLELLERLRSEGITLIVVTHDPSVARRSNRVIVLKDGAVARRLAGSEMTTLAEALAEGQGSSA